MTQELFCEMQNFSDVTLVGKNGQVVANKVVLAASSPFFKRTLKMDNTATDQGVHLPDVEVGCLKAFMEIIHKGETWVHEDDVEKMLNVAEKFEFLNEIRVKEAIEGENEGWQAARNSGKDQDDQPQGEDGEDQDGEQDQQEDEDDKDGEEDEDDKDGEEDEDGEDGEDEDEDDQGSSEDEAEMLGILLGTREVHITGNITGNITVKDEMKDGKVIKKFEDFEDDGIVEGIYFWEF